MKEQNQKDDDESQPVDEEVEEEPKDEAKRSCLVQHVSRIHFHEVTNNKNYELKEYKLVSIHITSHYYVETNKTRMKR